MKSTRQNNEFTFDARKNVHQKFDRGLQPEVNTGVLRIVIPFTTHELTRAALKHAAVCTDLNVRLALLDIQVVPFPSPLDRPPINKEFSEQRLRGLFMESGLPGTIDVVYVRQWLNGFGRTLEPHSVVILATKKRWWQTREAKLAQALMKTGHHVMLVKV